MRQRLESLNLSWTGKVNQAMDFLFANNTHSALTEVVNKPKFNAMHRWSVSNAPEHLRFLPLILFFFFTRRQYGVYFSVCNFGWRSGSGASLGHEASSLRAEEWRGFHIRDAVAAEYIVNADRHEKFTAIIWIWLFKKTLHVGVRK